jgi:hypothetical protein
VGSNGTVRLERGVFDFGSSAVYVPDARLVGDGFDENGDPRTVIEGGLVPIRVAFLHGRERIRVDGLWFRGATYMAVNGYYIDIDQLDVTNNKITQMQLLPEEALLPYRLAIWVEGWEQCRVGVIHVQGNVIDNIEDTPQLPPSGGSDFGPDDNGVNILSCAVKNVVITHNVIRNQGEPVEVFANSGPTARIVVADNDLKVGGDDTFGALGIIVSHNEGTTVRVNDNELALQNGLGDSAAIVVSHRTPRASFEMRNNVVSIEGSVFAAMIVGLADVSLSDAVIADNRFSGDVATFGIWANDFFGFSNQSRNNVFRQNDFSGLDTSLCRVTLGPSTRNNRFVHNVGLALDCDSGKHNTLVE